MGRLRCCQKHKQLIKPSIAEPPVRGVFYHLNSGAGYTSYGWTWSMMMMTIINNNAGPMMHHSSTFFPFQQTIALP
jgi:hypothetical protein